MAMFTQRIRGGGKGVDSVARGTKIFFVRLFRKARESALAGGRGLRNRWAGRLVDLVGLVDAGMVSIEGELLEGA